MFKLTYYLKDFKKEVILGPIFKLLEAVFELIVPLVMAKIIDIGIGTSNSNYIFKMGGLLILFAFTGLTCAIICQYFASRASQEIGTNIRNDLFKHINSLSHSEIDKIGTATLITRITNDVNIIQNAIAMLIRLAFRAPFLIIGSTIMAMTIDLKLSIIFLIATPFIALVIYIIMSKSIPFYSKIQGKLDHISLLTGENLEGARVVRAFSNEEYEMKKFYNASDDLSTESINVGKISALLNPITSLIANFAIIAILWFGGANVNSGSLLRGDIVALINYMNSILLTLIVLANLIVLFTKAFASIKRVREIFEIQSSITEESVIETKKVNSSKITFNNVFFHFNDSNEYSLSDINVSIEPGETIGVIGGTGSGKSTFVNLIPRFYDASEGSVLVDGIDIKGYKLKDLRKKISIVPQHCVLFSGTIRSNLTLGNENASDEEIANALDIAQASEFVNKLPEKYDTIVSEGGKNLSGGQKQRLTIARALLCNPEILILDDSSSALDFATDALLRKALREKTKDMTVIMVSQRASTVKTADKIIVFDNGEIKGVGTHDYLFDNCEVYKEICLSQLSEKEVAL
ncbi:MAG: ABC transporter ATP-binding protein/permease [Clostridium sp.]|uniref:ABC transporter ATP-binding protein n=1 Tax=Clostridium sp. DSM 8431 TaxID=1761781 RepID=UPI0008E89520|nr:ABC transporter ATP-binding protein [Clostridium sp. DSM 8431]MCR4944716.1 ABC transporter ATP-binding protein/permease [Clostridium sp.]SFU51420.1 ATP-binding cassette, subfamily B [Clostridium sp. DSM 8431]